MRVCGEAGRIGVQVVADVLVWVVVCVARSKCVVFDNVCVAVCCVSRGLISTRVSDRQTVGLLLARFLVDPGRLYSSESEVRVSSLRVERAFRRCRHVVSISRLGWVWSVPRTACFGGWAGSGSRRNAVGARKRKSELCGSVDRLGPWGALVRRRKTVRAWQRRRRSRGAKKMIKKASVGRLLSNDCTKVIGVGNVRLIVRFVGLCQSRWVPVWCSLSSYGPITGARRHSQTSRREGMSS